MVSKETLRIRDILVEVEKEDIRQRIAMCLSAYSPSLRNRFSSFIGAPDSKAKSAVCLSLASQNQEQVAIVSLASPDIKSQVLRQHAILDKWRLDDHFLGLTVLHSPEDHEADIYAIHGLGGNGFDTWASSSTMWLRDLLPSSAPFDKCRISTFGYSSSLADRSAYAGIRQWPVDFLNQVSHIRTSEDDRQRPLIIEQRVEIMDLKLTLPKVLNRLGSFPSQHPSIRLDQGGALFLATPHSGTREADWNDMLLAISEQAFGVRNRDLVANLRSFNENSMASKERFSALSPPPPFYCLCEGKKVPYSRLRSFVL
ncbi:MAG: hypothetical protein M1828_003003 [Chrysothrix sp. TS-e1954]|nr:MAG: hypothetical protein M1828_003003 [Chrysothrix sp. TS-e1954]